MADNTNSTTSTDDAKDAPWGDDFDAARAWTLVQNLRTEKDALKTERDSLKSDLQARDDEKKSDADKLADKLAAEADRANKAEKALAVARVLRDFPDLADFEDLLDGADEEAIRTKAERLAKIGAKDGAKDGEKDGAKGNSVDPLGDKPKPNLIPGHGGDQVPEFDAKAIADAARAAF